MFVWEERWEISQEKFVGIVDTDSSLRMFAGKVHVECLLRVFVRKIRF